MPLTLIKGVYRISGTSPDGDSVRFYPQDPSVWASSGIRAKANAQGGVRLRLEAIDALEIYAPPHSPAQWHHPTTSAHAPELACWTCSRSLR